MHLTYILTMRYTQGHGVLPSLSTRNVNAKDTRKDVVEVEDHGVHQPCCKEATLDGIGPSVIEKCRIVRSVRNLLQWRMQQAHRQMWLIRWVCCVMYRPQTKSPRAMAGPLQAPKS